MVFAAHTLALLYFLQMESVVVRKVCAKNKQVQPNPQSKNARHKKPPEAMVT